MQCLSRFSLIALWAFVFVATGCNDQRLTTPARPGLQKPTKVRLEAGSVLQVSTGASANHTCALKTDGSVVCWGKNLDLQAMPPAGPFTQVSVFADGTCGLTASATIQCWGEILSPAIPSGGNYAQVSTGLANVCGLHIDGSLTCGGDALGSGFTQVSSGTQHVCAIKTDQTVACFYANPNGQASPPAGTFTEVSAGNQHTCGVKTDATVVCWGLNTSGQASAPSGSFTTVSAGSVHSCGLKTDQTVVCWGDNSDGETSVPSGTFTQVAAGNAHTCALSTTGLVQCWGSNNFGQSTPPTDGNYTQVSSGGLHYCALRADATIACFGDNTEPTPPTGSFLQVGAGSDYACAIKSDKTVTCWGDNTDGQATPPNGTFSQLSNFYNACAVRTDGTVACWGTNAFGQSTPPSGSFTQVSAGATHACGVKTDGSIACWGDNGSGELNAPSGTFSRVAAGDAHTCAIKADASLVCWGENDHFESTPPTTGSYTDVGAGSNFSCALSTTGAVSCWGSIPFQTPVTTQGLYTSLSVGAHALEACGLEVDQSIACWGQRALAQSPGRAPTASVGGPYSGFEGSPVTLALSATDFEGDQITYSWNLGDGTTGTGSTPPTSHIYPDDGVYHITLTASDKDGSDTRSTTATIANVPPSIASGGLTGPATPIQLVNGQASAPISVTFTDPAGSYDTYVASIQCGNGSTVSAAVNVGVANTVTCSYTATGIYTVQGTVSDDDGGTSNVAQFQYVVVYDPNGGFTTGGGWFTSTPADCQAVCDALNHKAHFAFNAKFQNGQTTPNGAAKLWLDGASFQFESTSLTMMVVVGAEVQFWGNGRLNGVTGYTFRITAMDGQSNAGGAFRMEIWDPGNIRIYDDQWGAPQNAPVTRAIEAGAIQIH